MTYKYLSLLFALSLFPFKMLCSQQWTYKTDENVFDGKYKTAYVTGKGGEFPYNAPMLVVNVFEKSNNINIYVTKAGYAGCDNNRALVKFDNDNNTYSFDISTNADKDVWFLEIGNDKKTYSLTITEFIEKLKQHNIIYIRLKSDCLQNDYEFSLMGSTAALNYVTSDFLKNLSKYLKQQEEERKLKEAEEKLREQKQKFLDSIGTFSAIIRFDRTSILLEPDILKPYKNIELSKGEQIVFTNYLPHSDYFILNKATTINLSKDTIFYISRFAIDILSIEKIDTIK